MSTDAKETPRTEAAIFDLTEAAKTAEHHGVDAHDIPPESIRAVLAKLAGVERELAEAREEIERNRSARAREVDANNPTHQSLTEIAAIIARHAPDDQDRRRLDWLDEMPVHEAIDVINCQSKSKYPTIRAAIDAAMKGSQ